MAKFKTDKYIQATRDLLKEGYKVDQIHKASGWDMDAIQAVADEVSAKKPAPKVAVKPKPAPKPAPYADTRGTVDDLTRRTQAVGKGQDYQKKKGVFGVDATEYTDPKDYVDPRPVFEPKELSSREVMLAGITGVGTIPSKVAISAGAKLVASGSKAKAAVGKGVQAAGNIAQSAERAKGLKGVAARTTHRAVTGGLENVGFEVALRPDQIINDPAGFARQIPTIAAFGGAMKAGIGGLAEIGGRGTDVAPKNNAHEQVYADLVERGYIEDPAFTAQRQAGNVTAEPVTAREAAPAIQETGAVVNASESSPAAKRESPITEARIARQKQESTLRSLGFGDDEITAIHPDVRGRLASEGVTPDRIEIMDDGSVSVKGKKGGFVTYSAPKMEVELTPAVSEPTTVAEPTVSAAAEAPTQPVTAPATQYTPEPVIASESARGAINEAAPVKPGVESLAGDIGDEVILPTEQVKRDPFRFQYKDENPPGETPYNPKWADVVDVWLDPADGETYVVNGHKRDAWAKRDGAPTERVRYINASTAEEARLIGALKNISQNSGTAVDAAKVFRESSMTPDDLAAEGISMRGTIARDGISLSKLPDDLFNDVVSQRTTIQRGAQIGSMLDNHADMRALAERLDDFERRGDRVTNDEIPEIVRAVQNAPRASKTEATLFGNETTEWNLVREVGRLSAWVKRELKADHASFKSAAKNAERLKKGNNVIDVEVSQAIAKNAEQVGEIYDKLNGYKGTISEAVNDAAKRVAEGENADAVRQRLYTTVHEEVRKAITGSEDAGAPRVQEAGRDRTEAAATTAREDGSQPAGSEPELGFEQSAPESGIIQDVSKGKEPVAKPSPEPVNATGDAGSKTGIAKTTEDPNGLIFRESEQNSLDEMRDLAIQDGGVMPITAVRTTEGTKILDGHNRTAVAKELDMQVPTVSIDEATYNELRSRGYDDIEISAGMLDHAGEHDAFGNLDMQFQGANVASRGYEVSDLIDELNPNPPASGVSDAIATPEATAIEQPDLTSTPETQSKAMPAAGEGQVKQDKQEWEMTPDEFAQSGSLVVQGKSSKSRGRIYFQTNDGVTMYDIPEQQRGKLTVSPSDAIRNIHRRVVVGASKSSRATVPPEVMAYYSDPTPTKPAPKTTAAERRDAMLEKSQNTDDWVAGADEGKAAGKPSESNGGAAGEAAGKQSWEMTREEWQQANTAQFENVRNLQAQLDKEQSRLTQLKSVEARSKSMSKITALKRQLRDAEITVNESFGGETARYHAVLRATMEGNQLPQSVLDDYPDLAPAQPTPKAAESNASATAEAAGLNTPDVIEARAKQSALPSSHRIDTPERQALRDSIVNKLSDTTSVEQGKQAYIVIGPPASGKSGIAKPLARDAKALIIDADLAKEMLPEYEGGKYAGVVHQESSDIAWRVLDKAANNGDNVVLPIVGKNVNKLRMYRDLLAGEGYDVHLRLVDLDATKAATRAVERFKKTGRFVDPEYVLGIGDNPRQNYGIMKEDGGFASYGTYSTDVPRGEAARVTEKPAAGADAPGGRSVRGHDTEGATGTAEAQTGAEELTTPRKSTFTVSPDELNYDTAYEAHRHSSFTPEKRAKQVQQDFAEHIQAVYEKMKRLADSPDRLDLLDSEMAIYKKGYLRKIRAKLAADSQTASTMITGRSGFNAARNTKKLDTAHRRLTELLEWDEKAQKAIRKKITPESSRVISSDATDAVERIDSRVAKLEANQERMKEVNAAYRKAKGAEGWEEGLNLTDAEKKEIATTFRVAPWTKSPYPSYALTNNSANIRRLKERSVTVAEQKAAPESEIEFDGGSIVENADNNRVQILFDEKPNTEVRTKLKSRGFRWSPSEGAWQRQRTPEALSVAKDIAGIKDPEPVVASTEPVQRTAPASDTRKIHQDLSIEGNSKLDDGRVVTYEMNFDDNWPNGGYRYKVESPDGTVQYGKWQKSIATMQGSGELRKLLTKGEAVKPTPSKPKPAPKTAPDVVTATSDVVKPSRTAITDYTISDNYSGGKATAILTKSGEFVTYADRLKTDDPLAVLQSAADAIRSAPSFAKLREASIRFDKSLSRTSEVSTEYITQMDLQPWKYLTRHASVMNAKSARAVTLSKLADAVFKETGLPRKPMGKFRGENGLDFERLQPESKPAPTATKPTPSQQHPANIGESVADAQAAKPKPLRMDGTTRPEPSAKKPAPEFASLHPKSQEKFNAAWDGKSADAMNELLYPENKGLRAEFESRSGVKLPKTVKGTREVVAEYFSGDTTAAATKPAPDFGDTRKARTEQKQAETERTQPRIEGTDEFELSRPKDAARIEKPKAELTKAEAEVAGRKQEELFGAESDAKAVEGGLFGAGKEQPKKTLADIEAEAAQRVNEVVPKADVPTPGGTLKIVGEKPGRAEKSAKHKFDDPQMEADYQEGLKSHTGPGLLEKSRQAVADAYHGITRTYKGIPRTAEFAETNEALRRIRHATIVAKDKALRTFINDDLAGLSPEQRDLFNRAKVLRDMADMVKREERLPFGWDPDSVLGELSRVDEALGAEPTLAERVTRSDEKMNVLVDELINTYADLGMDISNRFTRENYMRHIVLDYVGEQRISGTGNNVQARRSPDYAKGRTGSTRGIVTDYGVAQYEVISKMLRDIEVAKQIKRIESLDISSEVKADAKSTDLKDWRKAIPDGYEIYQPINGKHFFFAETLPDKLMREIADGTLLEMGISPESIRQVMGIGQPMREWVIPKGVADTLNNFIDTEPQGRLIKAWKRNALYNPKTIANYLLRNRLGDLEASFMGLGRDAFRNTRRAAGELWQHTYSTRAPQGELAEYTKRGGSAVTLQVEEIGNIDKFNKTMRFIREGRTFKGKAQDIVEAYPTFVNDFANWQEGIARYANYLTYLDQINADIAKGGSGKPRNFGASNPKEIMALGDMRDRAFKLSNELIGAYDQVSQTGRQIRSKAIPFWSFQELNLSRNVRFWKNVVADEGIATAVGRKMFGKAVSKSSTVALRAGTMALKFAGFNALLMTWNNARYGDQEKELSSYWKRQPHLIVGVNADGSPRVIGNFELVTDALEWIGADEAPGDVYDYISGRRSLEEIVVDNVKKPINKIAGAVYPIQKTLFEALAGYKTYPDVTKPSRIRDRGEYLAKSVKVDAEYRALAGKPSPGYLKENTKNLLGRTVDTNQDAYYDVLDLKDKYLQGKGRGQGSSSGPRNNALYYYKQALYVGDKEAAARYKKKYEQLDGTDKGMEQSLRASHPLNGLNKEDRSAFVESLSPEDKKRLKKAEEYWGKLVAASGMDVKPPGSGSGHKASPRGAAKPRIVR